MLFTPVAQVCGAAGAAPRVGEHRAAWRAARFEWVVTRELREQTDQTSTFRCLLHFGGKGAERRGATSRGIR